MGHFDILSRTYWFLGLCSVVFCLGAIFHLWTALSDKPFSQEQRVQDLGTAVIFMLGLILSFIVLAIVVYFNP